MKTKTVILGLGLLLTLISLSSFKNNNPQIGVKEISKIRGYSDYELLKVEKVSINEATITKFLSSEIFKNFGNGNIKIDESNILHYFIKDLSVTLYTVNIIGQPNLQFIIYKLADNSTSYAFGEIKSLENGNKLSSLSSLDGQLYYSYELNKEMKIGNLSFNKVSSIKFDKSNNYVSYNVLVCMGRAQADCDQSWSCQAMCFVLGPSGCPAIWLAGCLARENT
jgi:hypothetical protein